MRRRVCVVGGGISGLSAAHFIKHRAKKYSMPVSVKVVDSARRFGGKMLTARCEGFLFETGPRSLRMAENAVATLHLIRNLRLENEMITAPQPMGLNYKDGKVDLFERHLKFKDTMHVLGRLIREPFVSRTRKDDESIYDWSMRRLGPYLTEWAVDPLITGIYAGDIRQLSMRSCLPKYWNMEKEHGSLVFGMLHARKTRREEGLDSPWRKLLNEFPEMPLSYNGVFSFKEGISTLSSALEKDLESDEKILGKSVTAIEFRKHLNNAAVQLDDGSVIECDEIVSALPAHVLAPLLKPHNERLSELFGEIKSNSLAVVNFGYMGHVGGFPDSAFGYLVPSAEKDIEVLGVVFDTATFPVQNPGRTVLSAMIGSSRYPRLLQVPDSEIAVHAMRHISYHLKKLTPSVTNVTIWPNAIPQYPVGHHKRVEEIEEILKEKLPQLHIVGNSLTGVGVHDCTMRSRKIAKRILSKRTKQDTEDSPIMNDD